MFFQCILNGGLKYTMIHFNVPPVTGNEVKYIQEAIAAHKICGDGAFTKKCHAWFEERLNTYRGGATNK